MIIILKHIILSNIPRKVCEMCIWRYKVIALLLCLVLYDVGLSEITNPISRPCFKLLILSTDYVSSC